MSRRSVDSCFWSGTLLGRFEWLSEFVPRLYVPDETVLAEGTVDYGVDVALQAAISGRFRLGGGALDPLEPEAWDEVPAEVLTFDDPRPWLLRIDHLEGFRTDQQNFYRRVLVPLLSSANEAGSAYFAPKEDARW